MTDASASTPTLHATIPVEPRPSRLQGVDAVRYIAALFVIVAHAIASVDLPQGSWWWLVNLSAHFVVPFFFISPGYFLGGKDLPVPTAVYKILIRLGIPYLVWLAFYVLVFGDFDKLSAPRQLVSTLISGGSVAYHLWFMPVLGVCLALLLVLRKFLSPRLLLLVSLVALVACLASSSYHDAIGLDGTGGRGGFLMGIALVLGGYVLRAYGIRIEFGPALLIALAGYALSVAEASLLGRTSVTETSFMFGSMLFGLGVFLASITPAANALDRLAPLGRISLGVYCIHLFFLRMAILVLPEAGVIVLTIATAILSTVACLLMVRVPYLRKIVS